MKVAALDLGSNTFLCLIADVIDRKITRIHEDVIEVVRLGQDVDKTKRLHTEALARADVCLKKFKKVIEFHKPDFVLAMATSAARDSENRDQLFNIGKNYGIPIEIIPGSEEANITFQGAMSGNDFTGRSLVVDIGGGSTEFIIGSSDRIEISKSLNLGCVRLTERFITAQPTPPEQMSQAENYITSQFAELDSFVSFQVDSVLAVAGTPVALAAAQIGRYDATEIDGFLLTKVMLLRWKDQLQAATYEEKIKLGIPAGRADVILIGVLILLQTLEKFNKKQILVSTRGVRHGIALEISHRFRN